MLTLLFKSFGFIAPNTLNYLAFQSFNIVHTWWRFFQKVIVCTKFDIYVFIQMSRKFQENLIRNEKIPPPQIMYLYVLLMVFSPTLNNMYFSYIVAISFIGGGNRRTRRNPTYRKSLTNFMLYSSPWSRFELTTSVVVDTDCLCNYKSNYHTITATTSPSWFYMK
jgi:hypothetical protein